VTVGDDERRPNNAADDVLGADAAWADGGAVWADERVENSVDDGWPPDPGNDDPVIDDPVIDDSVIDDPAEGDESVRWPIVADESEIGFSFPLDDSGDWLASGSDDASVPVAEIWPALDDVTRFGHDGPAHVAPAAASFDELADLPAFAVGDHDTAPIPIGNLAALRSPDDSEVHDLDVDDLASLYDEPRAADSAGDEPVAPVMPRRAPIVIVDGALDSHAPGSGVAPGPVAPTPRASKSRFGRGRNKPGPPVEQPMAARRVTPQASAGHDGPLETSGPPITSGPRSLIVIDADNPVDRSTPGATDLPAPDVDPRIRARRRSVGRAAGLRRLRRGLLVGVPLLLALGAVLVFTSPLISVRKVTVTGNVYSDSGAVNQIVANLRDTPMSRVDLGEVRSQLLLDPWVRRVSARRDWPSTIVIDIAERVPVAGYTQTGEQWFIYDIDGRVMSVLPSRPDNVMAVVGDPTPINPGGDVGQPMIDAGRVAQALPKRLRDQVAHVQVGPDLRMQLQLTSKAVIYLGTVAELREKLVSVLTVLDKCGGVSFTSLNVDAPKDIVIQPKSACTGKPGSGGGTSAPAANPTTTKPGTSTTQPVISGP
jgi:cell division protein FtsQ